MLGLQQPVYPSQQTLGRHAVGSMVRSGHDPEDPAAVLGPSQHTLLLRLILP